MDKLKLFTDWKVVDSSPIVNGKLNPRKMSIDNWLNHEYGHLLHMTTDYKEVPLFCYVFL